MPLVKVGPRGRITIPQRIRKETDVEIGSFMESETRRNLIIPKPVKVVELTSARDMDAAIEEGLKDYREGRVSGPFENMREFRSHLGRKTR